MSVVRGDERSSWRWSRRQRQRQRHASLVFALQRLCERHLIAYSMCIHLALTHSHSHTCTLTLAPHNYERFYCPIDLTPKTGREAQTQAQTQTETQTQTRSRRGRNSQREHQNQNKSENCKIKKKTTKAKQGKHTIIVSVCVCCFSTVSTVFLFASLFSFLPLLQLLFLFFGKAPQNK